jgi:sirohydrochlorin ferrochelatase
VPIDIKQFKEASRPLSERVLGFLKDHPEQAYSLMELMAELEGKADAASMAWIVAIERMSGKKEGSATLNKYSKALEELLKQGKVTEAQLQGTTYYAYGGGHP